MDTYLLINIAFILMLFVYAYIDKFMHKSISIPCITLLILIFAVIIAHRPIDTPDTAGYVRGFFSIEPGVDYHISYLEEYNNYEKGYIQLIQLFKYLSTNYILFFCVVAFLGTIMSVWAQSSLYQNLKRDVLPPYGLILAIYIAMFGLLYNGISVRAGLAMGLGLMFVSEFIRSHYLKAILCILVAFAMQRTSMIFIAILLIYLFVPTFNKKTYWFIWGILGGILFVFDVSGLSTELAQNINMFLSVTSIDGYSSYLEDLGTENGLPSYFFWLVSGFLIILRDNSKIYDKYLNVVLAGVVIACLFGGVRAIARVYDMFFLFLVPLLTYNLDKRTKSVTTSRLQNFKITRLGVFLVICVASYIMLKNSLKF